MMFTNRRRVQWHPIISTELRQVVPPNLLLEDDSSSDDDDGNQKRSTKKRRRPCLDRLRLMLLTSSSRSSTLLLPLVGLVAALGAFLLRQQPTSSPSTFSAKPSMVGCLFRDVASSSFTGKVLRMEPPQRMHRRKVQPMSRSLHEIEDASEDQAYQKDRYPLENPNPKVCKPTYEWQTKSYPNCNNLHEQSPMRDRMVWEPAIRTDQSHRHKLRRRLSMHSPTEKKKPMIHYQLLANGWWRDTWKLQLPQHQPVALKTLRYRQEYTEYVLDKQRRDALVSDRMQFSSQAIRMYGYCGTSGLYEYAPEGDLMEFINANANDWQEFDSQELLQLAYNVTASLAHLHTTEDHHHQKHQHSAIVHADFNANQFVAVAPATSSNKIPQFKLGDFNLARLVYWNTKEHHPCVVQTDAAGGPFRAPEEYAREHGRTEKLDVFSLGSLIYTIVTGRWPFDDLGERRPDGKPAMKEYKEKILAGKRPRVDEHLLESDDPSIQAMVTALEMCWKQDPHDRSSATHVLHYLAQYLPGAQEQQVLVGDAPAHHHHRRGRHGRQRRV